MVTAGAAKPRRIRNDSLSVDVPAATDAACTSSTDPGGVGVRRSSGRAHAQSYTARSALLSFTHLPVTIETRRRRTQELAGRHKRRRPELNPNGGSKKKKLSSLIKNVPLLVT